ncbi:MULTISPECIES: AraC family transcriptional regulator [unclassified Shewanella]|uniref:AraC family transcriptional regulator n=1 Tax=unclassified Shewanella TaxID=196818 RepID=UPI001BBCAAAC|nr:MULTISPECIES: AraC family transcriptional regulator [unclassified Shewanella]GIU20772.1 AraC family transcriptional regulator [Shewanella sp. MBTL60-112-B1]GIU29991.1 AraC family transcriptional regulator [Shewanella sp. MBTL60-112-B2]
MQQVAYAQDKCIDSSLLVASLITLFEYRHLSIHQLLTGTGIFEQDIRTLNHKINPIQLSQLIDNALDLWPGDDLAFLLGQQWLPSQSGNLTNGLLCSSNLNQLLSFWQQYHWQTQPWLQGFRWQTTKQQHLILQLDIGASRQQQFFIELSLSSLVSTYKRLSGQPWQGHFSLPFSQPKHIDQYHKYLGEKLSFAQPICVVSYDLSVDNQPFNMADQQGFKLAELKAEQQQKQAQYSCGLPGMISHLLTREQSKSYTLPDIAAKLALSPATLKRRLKPFNISFQQLQDQANLHNAIYLLAISGESNLEVAQQLKFADSNNFRRSFKRWTGQLPSQFRYWLSQT